MNKLIKEVFIFLLFFPLLIIYGKGIDDYRAIEVEPKLGMKCGDGNPIESWYATERILTPTADCMTIEHYADYSKWFTMKAIEFIKDNEDKLDPVLAYLKEVTINMSLVVGELIRSVL